MCHDLKRLVPFQTGLSVQPLKNINHSHERILCALLQRRVAGCVHT